MTSLRDIGVSAILNVGITMAFLVGFLVLSVQPVNDRVYHSKLYIKGSRKGRPRTSTRQRKQIERYFNTDLHQYFRLSSWVRAALRMSEQELIEHAGLDSAVFLRIFLVGLKVFVPMMVLGIAILIPVNVGAGNLNDNGTNAVNTNTSGSSNKLLFSSIDKLSISNIKVGSMRLWAHLVMAYVFTAWTCYILFVEYRTVTRMRLRFHASERRRPDQFTVLVRQVPDQGKESVNTKVESYFQTNHPDYYLTHQMVYNANDLSKIVRKREKAQNWLTFNQLKYSRDPSTKPTIKTGFCGLFGDQVDAIDHYTAQIEKLTQEAETERLVIIQDPKATMPAAFVSFKNRWGAAVCAQTQQNQDPTLWLTEWAPEPRDVFWKNLAIPYIQLGFRKLAVGVMVFLLVFFFMIPVATVQSLANLQGLQRTFPWLRGVLRKHFFASFVQGFLPGLILKVCLMLVPTICMLLSKMEGHLSHSKLERRAAAKYYYFVLVNVFLGSILTGSAFGQLKTFVSSSSFVGFLKTLAYSIPMKASFFITYIMVDGWSGPAGEIIRIFPLVIYHVKNTLFVKTERDRLQAADPGTISLNDTLPQLQLYFLMGLVYSIITPIIIPFIIAFFGFAYIVYRHQIINVYDPTYESAGAFWPHVHGRIIASMILEHLILIGLFLIQGPISFVKKAGGNSVRSRILNYIKEACSSTPFMIALPILTLFFHAYCKNRFEPAFKNYPLEDAMERDTVEREKEPDLNLAVFLRNAYKHPDFSDEKEEDNDTDIEKGEDTLPVSTAEEEYIDLDDVLEKDDEYDDNDEDGSPLIFKQGRFYQDSSDTDKDTGCLASVERNLSRADTFGSHDEASDLESVDSPLIFNRGTFYQDDQDEEKIGYLSPMKGSLRRYHSCLSMLDTASEISDLEDPGSPLIFKQGRFYEDSDGKDRNGAPSPSRGSMIRIFSRSSTLGTASEVSDLEDPGSPLIFKRGTFYEDDDEALSMLRGSMKRRLSRSSTLGTVSEVSDLEDPGSPLIFKQGTFYEGDDDAASLFGGGRTLSRTSTLGTVSESSDLEDLGSPLIFNRGTFYEGVGEEEDTDGNSPTLEGSGKQNSCANASGTVGEASEPGSLILKQGAFSEDDNGEEEGDRAPSPSLGAVAQDLSSSKSLGTVSEASQPSFPPVSKPVRFDVDCDREEKKKSVAPLHGSMEENLSPANTVGTANEVYEFEYPGSPLVSEPETLPQDDEQDKGRNESC